MVGRGRVLADASVAELVARASRDEVLVRTPAPDEAARVSAAGGTTAAVIDGESINVSGLAAQRVVEVLAESGVAFSEVTSQRATLEDVYLELTSGETEYRAGPSSQARP